MKALPALKQDLRRQARARALARGAHPGSEAACARVVAIGAEAYESWQGRVVALFRALPGEMDPRLLDGLLRGLGGRPVYPRVMEGGERMEFFVADPQRPLEWSAGFGGVLEPHASLPQMKAHEVDALLVPGLAFDRLGRRLGRGKGHYDRFLERAPQALRIGFTHAEDLLADPLPEDSWDQGMDFVVTENETLHVRRVA